MGVDEGPSEGEDDGDDEGLSLGDPDGDETNIKST